ncbi:MAG: spore wall synthesis complex protein [Mycobacteriales bacterium]
MPLSEHEQRLLDQIERALYQEDPKFASTVRSTDLRTHMKRRLRRAAFVLVLGFVVMMVGLVANLWAVGVAGFAVMVTALLLALNSWKRLGSAPAGLRSVGGESRPTRARRTPRSPGGSAAGGAGFLARIEERWKRRWDERGQQ